MPFELMTSWTLIEGAARGQAHDQEEFVRRYGPVVRSYLRKRWQAPRLLAEIDDAVQEVFLQCFKEGGALGRAERGRGCGFRAFLFGIARNVARTAESRRPGNRVQELGPGDDVEDPATSASRAFDRAWAAAILGEAADHQAAMAQKKSEAALERVEMLRLRFREGLPLREIARLWNAEPNRVHRQYAKGRDEFEQSLRAVLEAHNPGAPEVVQREWETLKALYG